MGAKTGPQIQDIAPGAPREDRSCESFDGKLRNECLRQEIVCSPKAAQAVVALWHNTCSRARMFGASPPWC
ncbi:integrase [Methylobacterium sp. AMS5]|nr:integrase [Methylobacterium sp. AMS5]